MSCRISLGPRDALGREPHDGRGGELCRASEHGVTCLAYALDDGEIATWLPGDPVPEPFRAAARDPSGWRLIAHNYAFERALLEHVLVPEHGFPSIPLEAQHCSQALSLANGYPAELDSGGAGARAPISEGPRRRTADAGDVAPAQAAKGRGQVRSALGGRSREARPAVPILRPGRARRPARSGNILR